MKLIKKAIGHAKGEFNNIVNKIGESENQLNRHKDHFLRVIKDTNDKHNRERHFIVREFEQARNKLVEKEKAILKELEQINKQNIIILTQFLDQINSTYDDSLKLRKSIQNTFQKDDVMLLEDYKAINEFVSSLKLLSTNTESIQGELINLNEESLKVHLNQVVQNIHSFKPEIFKELISTCLQPHK